MPAIAGQQYDRHLGIVCRGPDRVRGRLVERLVEGIERLRAVEGERPHPVLVIDLEGHRETFGLSSNGLRIDIAARRHRVDVLIGPEGRGAGDHAFHPVAQIVVIGRAEERVQVRHRLRREKFLDDRRMVGAPGVNVRTTAFCV
jgi:hypothetical protein